MNWNSHYNVEGKHAFLSPSSYRWLDYDDNRIRHLYDSYYAKIRGTELHDFAKKAIELGIRLPDNGETLSLYVNDAIDMGLRPEQVLYYSELCFGTADAIGIFDGVLHVHDLKNGVVKASYKQTLIYAALFFLEYGPYLGIHAETTPVELRIYQAREVQITTPPVEEVLSAMTNIIRIDTLLREIRFEKGV